MHSSWNWNWRKSQKGYNPSRELLESRAQNAKFGAGVGCSAFAIKGVAAMLQ